MNTYKLKKRDIYVLDKKSPNARPQEAKGYCRVVLHLKRLSATARPTPVCRGIFW